MLGYTLHWFLTTEPNKIYKSTMYLYARHAYSNHKQTLTGYVRVVVLGGMVGIAGVEADHFV